MKRAFILALLCAMSAGLATDVIVAAPTSMLVTIRTQTPSPFTIEWLTLPDQGKPSTIDTQKTVITDALQIAVAPDATHFVRFSRPGVSPVTVSTHELVANKTGWVLPDPTPGGEIVARILRATVTPEKYALRGPLVLEAEPHDGTIAFRGVRPGEYRFVPEYAGGFTGRRHSILVESSESKAFVLPPEPLGAVRMQTTATICRESQALTVTRVVRERHGKMFTGSRTESRPIPLADGCAMYLAGLLPGHYEGAYHSEKGTAALGEFDIEAQAIASADIGASAAHLSGMMRLNGSPMRNLTAIFMPTEGSISRYRITSDAGGGYEIALPSAGTYEVSFENDGDLLAGNDRQVEVEPGDNSIDLNLEGGVVHVDVSGWDRQAPLDLSINVRHASKPWNRFGSHRMKSADDLLWVSKGIAFGRYLVEAHEHYPGSTLPDRMDGQEITLDAAHTEADVHLNLRERSTILSLTDARNQPVVTASVRGASYLVGQPKVTDLGAGTFLLQNLIPASNIRISSAGVTPMCRTVPNAPKLHVTLLPGRTVTIQFSNLPGAISRPLGSIIWPGTDCDVSLLDFEFQRLPDPAENSATFMIANFPNVPGVRYAYGFHPLDEYQPLVPDPDGVIRITYKKP